MINTLKKIILVSEFCTEGFRLYQTREKFKTFHLQNVRKILGVSWQDTVSSSETLSYAGLPFDCLYGSQLLCETWSLRWTCCQESKRLYAVQSRVTSVHICVYSVVFVNGSSFEPCLKWFGFGTFLCCIW